MRIIDIVFLTAFVVVGVVLYWLVKYGDQAKDEFKRKWK